MDIINILKRDTGRPIFPEDDKIPLRNPPADLNHTTLDPRVFSPYVDISANVPFVSQVQVQHCGFACAQMILNYHLAVAADNVKRYVHGISKRLASVEPSRDWLEAVRTGGISVRDFVRIGFKVREPEKDSITPGFLALNLYSYGPIMILVDSYVNPENGHYVVLVAINDELAIFHDPWVGANQKWKVSRVHDMYAGALIYIQYIDNYEVDLDSGVFTRENWLRFSSASRFGISGSRNNRLLAQIDEALGTYDSVLNADRGKKQLERRMQILQQLRGYVSEWLEAKADKPNSKRMPPMLALRQQISQELAQIYRRLEKR